MGFNICIVGLGLMGASLAGALEGFKNATITGVDINEAVVQRALDEKIVQAATTDIYEAVKDADLLIFCVYARHIPELLGKCVAGIKQGAAVTDICGVKAALYKEILPLIPQNVSYVGIHPMAGKERDGIENATPTLYQNSSMLICPTESSTDEARGLMADMAKYIGCARIKECDYKRHDTIIAYTSDLMHVASAGLCVRYPQEMDLSFAAGAFRDCTRIADINAEAWTELLLENRENVLCTLDDYIKSLNHMRRAIADNNAPELSELLTQAGNNKREMLKR